MNLLIGFVCLVVLAGVAIWFIARRGQDLEADFRRQLAAETASDATRRRPLVTEESIAQLPAPVQRYVRLTGSVGKPRIAALQLAFNAEMFQKPGQTGMPGPIEQYDRFDTPKRLFFMKARMYGLPVIVLHDYAKTEATMRVRLASLFNVVDIKGEELSRTEMVTLLNDLCFFAPSLLADERLAWRPIDDLTAGVTFTNGPYKVSASLFFNAAGELANFVSDERGALQDDGSLRILRWSTPMRNYKEFGGRRYATEGEAIWHYPEGDFTYGRMTLSGIKAN
ncbi:MAG: DUF6544 family protein [Rhizobiaceae bacterium]